MSVAKFVGDFVSGRHKNAGELPFVVGGDYEELKVLLEKNAEKTEKIAQETLAEVKECIEISFGLGVSVVSSIAFASASFSMANACKENAYGLTCNYSRGLFYLTSAVCVLSIYFIIKRGSRR